MENSHLSFLTALTGTAAGDGFAKKSSNALEGEGDAPGFFTFLENLLQRSSDDEKPSIATLVDTDNNLLTAKSFSAQVMDTIGQEDTDSLNSASLNADPEAGLIAAPLTIAPNQTLSSDGAVGAQAVKPLFSNGSNTVSNGLTINSTLSSNESTDLAGEGLDIDLAESLESELRVPLNRTPATKPLAASLNSQMVPLAQNSAAELVDQTISSAVFREGDVEGVGRLSGARSDVVTTANDKSMFINPMRDQIVAAVSNRQGEGRLEVRLDPPELGKLLIGFEGDGPDNIVRAVISADSPETLDLLRRNADVFQRALEEQGMGTLDLEFRQDSQQESDKPSSIESSDHMSLAEADDVEGQNPVGVMIETGRVDRRL
ncbi:flagellar hook-length control protein FliK [Hyphococcus sp. DH-69]|uniref:flagellar hook-length control protein FliK n=1 Tax=Hyphococcus formosus TaxID=3143534 RepID=UPI00398B40AA